MAGSIPPHINSISIPMVENQTVEFGISEAVTDNLVNQFLETNILQIDEENNADSILKGKIIDCAIDLRKKSKTFGKVFKIELSDKNCKSLYIPEGFAHAYFSIGKLNIIYYK